MTMTRRAKTQHTTELITAATTGYTRETFASPKLYRAAKADRGHARMTGTEYAQHRMGRGEMPADRLELQVELRARLRRGQRVLGGRRITGRQAGTKRPAAWRETTPRERTAHRASGYQPRHAG